VGSIPVAGDIFDLFFRAHARSSRVLLEHIKERQAAAVPAPPPKTQRRETPYHSPAPPPPPSPPEPQAHSQEDEWDQARRVEELRAQVRQRGGGIVRPRP
jgi:pyruvate/2-oxoacid:ferredoxin oxidoreductase alpha subunit